MSIGDRRGFPWIPAVGLAAIAIYLALTPTGGWDIWWHLQTGRVALEQHSTLPVDPFSFSFADQPWGHKDLLADVIFYLGFAGIGYAWFSVLKALVVIGIGAALFALGRRARAPDLFSTSIAGMVIVAVQYRVVERPVLFSLALFPVLILLLARLRRVSRVDGWRPAVTRVTAVVAILWLWSLLHREALIGIGLFGLEIVGVWTARFSSRDENRRPSSKFLLVVSTALVVACLLPLISPSGADFYTSSFTAARSEPLRAAITDWARIGPIELMRDFPISTALLLLSLLGVFAIVRRIRGGKEQLPGVRLAHVAALLFFTAATLFDSVRWVPYATAMAASLALFDPAGAGVSLGRVVARLGAVRGLSAVVVVAVLGTAFWQNNLGTGVGPMGDRYPSGAVDFAREHGLEGKVVNAFHLGGYLIWEAWPDTRVLIDGRNDVVYPPDFLLRALESQQREDLFRRMRGEDGATWVMAGNIPGHESHSFLARSASWMLVYWSEPALVYAARASHPQLADLELRHLVPTAVDASIADATRRHRGNPEQLEEIGEEVRRMLRASPNSLRANAAAAIHFHFSGSGFHQRRDEVLDRLEALHPEHPVVGQLRARLGLDR